MRVIKIAAWIIGGGVAVIILGAAAIYFLVDPNDYRDDIARRVEQATGRPLKIGGDIDLKLFPWLALQVNDVSLGNPPGYGAEPFLNIEHADVGVKLLPLLRQQIQVRRVRLDGLAVNLISRGEDDNNWQDLGDSSEPKHSQAGPRPQLRIAGLDVHKATLLYHDEEKKSLTRLTHIELHTAALGGDKPVPVSLEFDYDEGSPQSTLHFTTQTQLRLPKDSSRIELTHLLVKSAKLSVRAPQLVLDTAAQTLAPAALELNFGALPLQVTAAGDKIFSHRVITGKVSMPRVSLRELLPSMGIELPKARDPTVLTALALQSDYKLTENAVQLTGLDLNLDDSRIRGRLGVDDLDSKALAFDLAVDSINLDRYREPEVKSETVKKPQEPPTDLPLEALRKLNAHGSLRIGRATVADLKFTDVRLAVEAAAGRIRVTPQGKLFGGIYTGDILLDARPAKARLSLNERMQGIDVGALVSALFDTSRLVGRGDASAVLTGTGNTDAALLASLGGKISANLKEGALNGVDLWYELRRGLALVKRSAAPQRTEPVRTPFKTFAGSATLADGVVRNDDLRLDMDYLKARGKGTLSIATQAVDYRVTAEIYKLPAEGAGSELADLKALEIPIAITGTLADMKVRPDLGDLAKARLHKEVDKQKEDLKKKVQDKLKDLLGG